jgi:tripartite-type tricarboxylate transporter receptor subunit TctC
MRRRVLGLKMCKAIAACAVAAMWAFAQVGIAQDYPSKPITIVVPFAAGSVTDTLVRVLAAELQKLLGQPVLVDDKPGAQGVLGTRYGASAKPDGYTLLAGSSTTLAANVGLFKKLPYDPVKDFQPIAGFGYTSMMFMVRADSPAKDLKSFLALARKESLPMASAFASSSGQVALALLSTASGVKFTPVPYKSTPQAITDLIGGQIPMAVVDVGSGMTQIRGGGRLTALAISGASRSVSAPDVPTLAESFPNIELVTWIGLVAPAGTPMAVVDKLYSAIANALGSAEVKQKFAAASTEVELVAPGDLAKRMQRDQARWIELIRAAGIPPE